MDIMLGEKPKKYIRLAVWMLRKKIGKSAEGYAIHEDMKICPNKAIRFLFMIFNKTALNVKEDYQRNTVRELGELALWIAYKDTGYNDIFFWTLDQILQNADWLREEIKPYVKDPEKWYVNSWSKSKANSKELRDKGIIPKNMMSPDEEIFTPEYQNQKLGFNKKKKKR